jgi:acyl-CoA synthetase (AMP-forming)/AMP-acid ligase II
MQSRYLLHEQLRTWATLQPHAPCIIEAETGNTLTYSQTFAATQSFRHHLGNSPRRILLALPGGIVNALTWVCALTGGHTLIPVAPDAPAQEIMRATASAPPDVVIVAQEKDAARFGQQNASTILTQNACEALIQSIKPHVGTIQPPAEGWAYFSTSGSTGQPKHVLLGEHHIAWAANQIRYSHRLSPDDRGLAVLPFFHVNAPVVSLCASLLAGSAVVIAPRFSRSRFWVWVEQYRVTWASIVPTILALLLQSEPPTTPPASLRFIRTASAPLPAIQLLQFERQFGIPVIETYGLTEAASQVCANSFPPEHHIPGSIGKPAGVSVRICHPGTEDKKPLQDVTQGETGELCIAGPSIVSSYVDGPPTSSFQDGWFRTGDLGYQDAEGYIYLIGRLRDIIIRGGESIAPREIEEVLLAHPAIRESAVIGRPDQLYGEQVIAFVVTRETWSDSLEQSIHQHCAEHLSHHKIPSTFIATQTLPRTPAGKIDRQSLPWQETQQKPSGADTDAA